MNRKYFAGFIDADGSIQIRARKLVDGTFTVQASVAISQLTFRDKPLRILAEEFDLTVYERQDRPQWSPVSDIVVNGNKAIRIIEQIKNHLVIKKEIAEFVLSVANTNVTELELKAIKSTLKDIRRRNYESPKPQVSGAWMAGYVDGDGCLRAQLRHNSLTTKLEVTTYKQDTAGIELLKKQFGGSICKHGSNAMRWVVHLTESNVDKVLGKYIKHSLIKRSQTEYVISFLRNRKHLQKEGATVQDLLQFKETLSEMKQPHRLSD